jgi:hypothetical protein
VSADLSTTSTSKQKRPPAGSPPPSDSGHASESSRSSSRQRSTPKSESSLSPPQIDRTTRTAQRMHVRAHRENRVGHCTPNP